MAAFFVLVAWELKAPLWQSVANPLSPEMRPGDPRIASGSLLVLRPQHIEMRQ